MFDLVSRRPLAAILLILALGVATSVTLGWLMARFGGEDVFDPGQGMKQWAQELSASCPPAGALIDPHLADGRMTSDELKIIIDLGKAYEGPSCIVPAMPSSDPGMVPYVPF